MKLKGPWRGTTFLVDTRLSDSTFRVLRVLVTAFVVWTSSTGTSHVVTDGTPLKRSEAMVSRGSLLPMYLLAVCMVLAISNDVLRLATGRKRSA